MLKNVSYLFQAYPFFFAVVWLIGLPVQVVGPAILLPRAGAKFWLALLTGLVVWTVCFLVELALFRFLKARFHERVLRALADQEVSNA